MKKGIAILALVILALMMGSGCTRPTVYAGYYVENQPDAKTTLLIGTNNSQANAVHSPLGADVQSAADDSASATREEDKNIKIARSSGLFVNNTVGDRAADIDATSALEFLKDVKASTAGQGQTTTKGAESPATGGAISQTPALSETRTVNIPLAVSQEGAVAQTGANPDKVTLNLKQAREPITAEQKTAIEKLVKADTTETVPAGLEYMTLDEWKFLKASYLECPECLILTDAERKALQEATKDKK